MSLIEDNDKLKLAKAVLKHRQIDKIKEIKIKKN